MCAFPYNACYEVDYVEVAQDGPGKINYKRRCQLRIGGARCGDGAGCIISSLYCYHACNGDDVHYSASKGRIGIQLCIY